MSSVVIDNLFISNGNKIIVGNIVGHNNSRINFVNINDGNIVNNNNFVINNSSSCIYYSDNCSDNCSKIIKIRKMAELNHVYFSYDHVFFLTITFF